MKSAPTAAVAVRVDGAGSVRAKANQSAARISASASAPSTWMVPADAGMASVARSTPAGMIDSRTMTRVAIPASAIEGTRRGLSTTQSAVSAPARASPASHCPCRTLAANNAAAGQVRASPRAPPIQTARVRSRSPCAANHAAAAATGSSACRPFESVRRNSVAIGVADRSYPARAVSPKRSGFAPAVGRGEALTSLRRTLNVDEDRQRFARLRELHDDVLRAPVWLAGAVHVDETDVTPRLIPDRNPVAAVFRRLDVRLVVHVDGGVQIRRLEVGCTVGVGPQDLQAIDPVFANVGVVVAVGVVEESHVDLLRDRRSHLEVVGLAVARHEPVHVGTRLVAAVDDGDVAQV